MLSLYLCISITPNNKRPRFLAHQSRSHEWGTFREACKTFRLPPANGDVPGVPGVPFPYADVAGYRTMMGTMEMQCNYVPGARRPIPAHTYRQTE